MFHATVDGAPAVCKAMSRNELDNLNAAQGAGVVRILHVTHDLASAKGTDQLQSNGGLAPTSALVAMEKLRDVQFYPRHDPGDPPIDTDLALRRALQSAATGGPKFRMTAPDKKRLGYLRDFLDAIVALNARGLMWCDVKQENCGVDGEGRVRIFDFGTFTRPIDDENRYIDILAYGKILFNTLVQAPAFVPGRHCTVHRFALNKAQLVSTVDLITGASPGVDSALRECFSIESSSSFDDIARVVRLLHAALLELEA